jgi:hypothetical protein
MNVNLNQTRTETETETGIPREGHPTGVTEHDDHHLPRKHDPKRTIMVVCGFVAALAMLVGLNMK